MHKAVFFSGQSEKVAEILEQSMPEGFCLEVCPSSTSDDEKIARIEEAEFLILHPADIDRNVLQNAKKLRHIQLLTAGYDKVDLAAARELGMTVATNGGTNAWAVAEQAIALLLCLYRRLVQCDTSVRAGTWRKPVSGTNTFEVAGKTIGLLGVGNIGGKVAQRLKAFETRIIYFDRFKNTGNDFDGESVSLERLLRESDVLSIHVPLTDETRGMFGAEQLAMMKPTAVIINTSRAEVFDEAALLDALRSRRIAGAGLDVFHREPLRADDGLLALDNVVLTPHTAGHSYEAWFRRADFAWQNIERVVAGEAPLSLAR
ncbi:2-hydroxyacid dehydrogenase [Propionivibrio dicarboxylicus]|uniref:Glyoxylate reductase n=1 Tax=Propionivibrio dicarboxylicus TaxID=83767 RepID=A0A1G8J411_9RHOO|nr:2-hydroxyacid dehydrogenase [Propionivibrio dicarboxylicus]SDI25717.1 glyoxylate reductase [Propionivibrio dicarboxylicus]